MTPIDDPVFVSAWRELPPDLDALRAECVRLRNHILDNAKLAIPALPNTPASFAAHLKGEKRGFMLPPMERLWLAAHALALAPGAVGASPPPSAKPSQADFFFTPPVFDTVDENGDFDPLASPWR